MLLPDRNIALFVDAEYAILHKTCEGFFCTAYFGSRIWREKFFLCNFACGALPQKLSAQFAHGAFERALLCIVGTAPVGIRKFAFQMTAIIHERPIPLARTALLWHGGLDEREKFGVRHFFGLQKEGMDEDSTDIGFDEYMRSVMRKRCNGSGCVRTDSGKGFQRFGILRELAAVVGHNGLYFGITRST